MLTFSFEIRNQYRRQEIKNKISLEKNLNCGNVHHQLTSDITIFSCEKADSLAIQN